MPTARSREHERAQTNEYDIAGHVGHEHATQPEDAHGVDQPSHRGEYQQEGRKGPVRRISDEACPEGNLVVRMGGGDGMTSPAWLGNLDPWAGPVLGMSEAMEPTGPWVRTCLAKSWRGLIR
jgi:hypothetical protein